MQELQAVLGRAKELRLSSAQIDSIRFALSSPETRELEPFEPVGRGLIYRPFWRFNESQLL